MFWLVLGMTLAVALAAFVVGIVALPARRAGRPLFTERGERVFRISDSQTAGSDSKAAEQGTGGTDDKVKPKAGAKRFSR